MLCVATCANSGRFASGLITPALLVTLALLGDYFTSLAIPACGGLLSLRQMRGNHFPLVEVMLHVINFLVGLVPFAG